jgi:hypothetical protein
MKERSMKDRACSVSMNNKRVVTLTDVRIDTTKKKTNRWINKYRDGGANGMPGSGRIVSEGYTDIVFVHANQL